MISNDSVTVTTVVRATAAEAFRIFTGEIDSWWRRGPAYRDQDGAMRFEAGRLLEGERQIARVVAWEPGIRLLLEWDTWSFRPGERTEVEVRFQPIGDGTRVTIEHRGWQPRGPGAGEFRAVAGLWWAALLPALRRVRLVS